VKTLKNKSLDSHPVINFFKRIITSREIGIFLGLVILFIFFSIFSRTFLTVNNLLNITRQVSIIGILSIGMTLAILIGGIDLSVGSVVAFVGVITADMMVSYELSIGLSIVIGLLVGVGIGFINGSLISFFKVPAFIATLGTMTIFRGATFIYTQGRPIYNLPRQFGFIGAGYVGPIPFPTIMFFIVIILASFLLKKTTLGRSIYSIGGNQEAALYSGIPVRRRQIITFCIVGFISALSGVILASRLRSGLPTAGQGYELTAIAAVILGGASITGGVGTVLGTFFGALLIGTLQNGLNLIGVDPFVLELITGIVIVFAVIIDRFKEKGLKLFTE